MDDCILWTGYVGNVGYGNDGGTPAHRKAYERVHGPVPKGLVVMHSCANRLCVNVDHLSVGTQHENRMEMVRRGVSGEQKISFEDAQLIRWCGRQGPKKYGWAKQVARVFGVSNNAISRIKLGHTFLEAG